MRKCERKITRPLAYASEFRMRQWVDDSRIIALVAKPTSGIPALLANGGNILKCWDILEENRLAGIRAL